MFKLWTSLFGDQPPASEPAIILEAASKTLKNHKYGDFNKSKDTYIEAFLKIAEKSPRRAARLLMSIEKERHPSKTDDLFAYAAPHISRLLATCDDKQLRRDIYKIILEGAPNANLADFMITQAKDIAKMLEGEFGHRLTQKIIEHASPRTQEILDAFEDAFAQLLQRSSSLIVTKQLCNAYRDIGLPLPSYLEDLRAGFVQKAISCIIIQKENRNYAEINKQLGEINGFGLGSTDKIKAYKAPVEKRPHSKIGQVALYQITHTPLGTKEALSLYLVCVEAECSINYSKPLTKFAGHNLRDLQMAFGLSEHPDEEVKALNKIMSPLLNPIDPPELFSDLAYHSPPIITAPSLTPAFRNSELTDPSNGVDLPDGQFNPSQYRDSVPVQQHQ